MVSYRPVLLHGAFIFILQEKIMQDIINTDEMKAKIESAVKDISSSAELR